MAGGGYGAERDKAALDNIQAEIDAFAATYTPGKLTMFFFPGGMGSQLFRDDYSSPSTKHDFDLTWLSTGILRGEAAKLALQPDGTDLSSRFVVASGFVDFCLRPYDPLQRWCDSKGIQLFTFGYDWRRSSRDAATLFLDGLLPRLDAAIGLAMNSGQPRGNLQNYAFVGHSLGGMVVKLALNRGNADFYVGRMKCAVTVGSPFYGYGGQLHRYLIGDKQLNWTLGDVDHNNRKMARIICSMPGGYEFVYMSRDTFLKYAGDFRTKDDPKYRLLDYPCRATDGTPADPYDPQDQGDNVYYPLFDNDDKLMLANAVPVAEDVAKPLEAGVAGKFYNIRGVQTQNGVPLNKTAVRSTWGRVSKLHFDPDRDDNPITDHWGPGDGTQPAWGARLLQQLDLPDHVFTITGSQQKVQHMHLMSNGDVQNKLQAILGVQELFPLIAWAPPPMSTREQFDAFLRNMPKDSPVDRKSAAQKRWELLEYIFSFSARERLKLMWRGFTDLLSSPRRDERGARPDRQPSATPPEPGRKGRRKPPKAK